MTATRRDWTTDWSALSAARVPVAGLAALASLRNDGGVHVRIDSGIAWVHWPAGRIDVVRALLPVTGVEFYLRRGDAWHRFGCRLPTDSTPPDREEKSLASVLIPSRIAITPAEAEPRAVLVLRVVRGGEPQPANAVECAFAGLATWAASATTQELASVRGACKGSRAVLLGSRLPAISGAKRYWGDSVLVPLGHRVEPDLSPAAVREAIGASRDDIVMLQEDGVELLTRSAFEPLTRARLRLAIQHATALEPST